MRLSDWRATERGQAVMTAKVAAAFAPALGVLGAPPDPVAFVAWGDDPNARYTIMAATDAGLIVVNVRVNVPQEGPRAAARLIRWGRVQVGELSVEAHHGHRYLTTQIEGYVLQGVDAAADQIGTWVAHLLACIDGRVVGEGAILSGHGGRASVARPPARATQRSASTRAKRPNVRSIHPHAVVPHVDPAGGEGSGS